MAPGLEDLAEAAVIRHGDKLILRYARTLSMADVATIKEKLAQSLPGVEAVIVNAEEMLVYRAGETA